MMEDLSRGLELPTERATVGLAGFASEVVALILSRGGERPAVLDEALLQQFMQTIITGNSAGLTSLRVEFRRLHVTPAVLAELYIPAAARRFGEAWLRDTLSFCDVTMGSARLQAILHEMTRNYFDEEMRGDLTGVVLVVVPADEQHTLGGLSLAWQLRRRGVSVCLQIGPTLETLRSLVANRRFDGALVSIASSRHVSGLTELVKAMKSCANHKLFVAVGGALSAQNDVTDCGADIITSDLNLALTRMGVVTMRPKAGRF